MPADTAFRPRLATLEDRTTPAASFADAVRAAEFVKATPAVLQQITARLTDPAVAINPATKTAILSTLPTLANQNRDAAGVLADYLRQLQHGIATEPQNAAYLSDVAGGVGYAQFLGLVNANYALNYALQYGFTVPPAPVPPPPPPPPNGGPDNSTGIPDTPGGTNPGGGDDNGDIPTGDTTDNSGMSATMPNLATLLQQPETNGVRVQDEVIGTGAEASATSTVQVYYTGWLTDGTQFDSNRTSTTPATFNLNGGVIQGFSRGIAGMKVGGIRNIYIPAALGYGATGSPPSIPPNSDLVFQVKLVGVTS